MTAQPVTYFVEVARFLPLLLRAQSDDATTDQTNLLSYRNIVNDVLPVRVAQRSVQVDQVGRSSA